MRKLHEIKNITTSACISGKLTNVGTGHSPSRVNHDNSLMCFVLLSAFNLCISELLPRASSFLMFIFFI